MNGLFLYEVFFCLGGLGPLHPSPGSPSRIINAGPSNSPFPPVMPMQHQGPVGTSSSIVLGVTPIGSLGRMGPNPSIDKTRLPQDYNLFPDISPPVSKEIEDEANSYFQRIYNHPPHPTLTIDEVLHMLKRFQDSHNKREKEVRIGGLSTLSATIGPRFGVSDVYC